MKALSIESGEEMALRLKALFQQEKYLEHLLNNNIEINEKVLEDFYLSNLNRFTRPARCRVRQVFISRLKHGEEGATRIKQVHEQLLAGEDFADLVERFSMTWQVDLKQVI